MSRPGWATVKSTNAKACALYHEISNVGKTIESSKKRVTWRLKVEEGKEFEISLTHSLASGKKVLRVDGIVKYTAKAMSFGDWDYVFNLPGGHVVHIIIKPSVDLNDMYDLIIDNVSFRRLPDRLESNRNKATSNSGPSNTGSSNYSSSYNYSSGNYGGSGHNSRDSSFTPWECTRCTLVNEKPLAPVCEACGHPKPDHISPAAAARAKATVEGRSAAPVSRSTASLTKKPSTSDDLIGASDNTFNPFGVEAANAFNSSFASTSNGQSTLTARGQEDITSMLSGLDFNTAPAPSVPTSTIPNYTQPPVSPNPAEDISNDRTGSGDLWESKMVDLNLNPNQKHKTTATSIRSHQTLEQARQSSFNKEKVPVMPLPAPAPVVMAAPAPGFYGIGAAGMPPGGGYYPQQGMMPPAGQFNTVGAYGNMVNTTVGGAMAAYGGMGMGMNMEAVTPVTQQSFMTAAPAAGPKKPAFYGSDPFATLS
ncbi:hypothetical protein Poli38472_004320 [Pythium oligandrum]|uniref:RanBP2-type domain-containing protein n=1 Tax=Pythium oligandrum TaxID=41045 RepID=A0A8K1FEB7_PYTOL|nr:hypothetical protein Poli38472_004320 [Pythium oligandrum]|eukprot:TMW59251.1 hypothetical protein Poli38472_004320 [Pythium oligandrum]